MLTNMRNLLRHPPSGHDRDSLAERFRPVREALGELNDCSHLESRIGNEVMFDRAELMGAPVQQTTGAGAVDRFLGLE